MAKPGPKPRGEFASKGATLSARITVETRRRLVEEAKKNNRSLSVELEERLERSFVDQADLQDFGSDQTYALLRFLADEIPRAQALVGKRWYEDRYAFDLVAETVRLIWGAFRPGGPNGTRFPPDTFPNYPGLERFPEEKRRLRADLAKRPLREIASPLAEGAVALLQAAVNFPSGNPLRQLALVLAPLITSPVPPPPREPDSFIDPDSREWVSEDAYRASISAKSGQGDL